MGQIISGENKVLQCSVFNLKAKLYFLYWLNVLSVSASTCLLLEISYVFSMFFIFSVFIYRTYYHFTVNIETDLESPLLLLFVKPFIYVHVFPCVIIMWLGK